MEILVGTHGESDLGELCHGSALISGLDAYRYFTFEGGVYRVQRVPKTEKSGHVHTSTVSMAVLPLPEEIDITLNPKDLQIETSRSSGQSVNTTDSCVLIVHLPTEIFAECQQLLQIKNKEMAVKTLHACLFQKQLDEQMQNMKSNRKFQVGSSGRSEKIRTSNFNQDLITHHRIGECLYNLNQFLLGWEGLNSMIKLLLQEEEKEKIIEFLTSITQRCN